MYFEYLANLLEETYGACKSAGEDSVYIFCPFCKPRHHKPKLSIQLSTELWHCFVCNKGGITLERLFKLSQQTKALTKLQNLKIEFNIKTFIAKKNIHKKYYTDNQSKNKELFTRVFNEKIIDLLDTDFYNNPEHSIYHKTIWFNCLQYVFKQRGLSFDKIELFNLKCDLVNEVILIPSFDKNNILNYYFERSIKNSFKKNPNLSKNNIIFNELFYQPIRDTVLVEGVFDSLKILRDFNIVSMLGKVLPSNSKLFDTLITNCNKFHTDIIVSLDNDSEGKKASAELIKLLLYHLKGGSKVYFLPLPDNIKDPAEFNNDDMFETYINKNKILVEEKRQIRKLFQ